MGSDNSIYLGFFLLIIITGILSSVTDLCHKKIRNNHLLIIAVAAVILTVVKGVSDRALPVLQLSSFGCAVVIALVFYKNDLWRGGDAKLFALFSLLMPATGYESKFFFPSIVLFVSSFTIALIFIGLSLFKDLCADPRSVTGNIRTVLKEFRPGKALAITTCVTWMIFPLLHACGLLKYGILPFLSIYMVQVFMGDKIYRLIDNKIFAVIVFACGLFLRYEFSPEFFLWKNMLIYVCTVIIYSLSSQILYRGTMLITKSNERIPFAPFLFLGCLASYTPFLRWVVSIQHLGK